MAEIPHAVLSDHFLEHMNGRQLVSAVFLTYQFEPDFFELEVLPAVLDVSVSHAAAIRLVQLEEALRAVRGSIAVYFDANGIVRGDAGTAKLDVRRIPIRHSPWIFHPKNVFLLVEDDEPDDAGHHPQTLIVATMSANLTRAGWWKNVEVFHVHEVAEGEKTRLRRDLLRFLHGVRRRSHSETDHSALNDVIGLLRGTEDHAHRSADGRLLSHFYGGGESVPDFLDRVAGPSLRDTCLEIISPYFDDASDCRPLQSLVERFSPRETRVFLPRSASGEALCSEDLYTAVRGIPSVSWGRLPKGLLSLGPGDDVAERPVHAKVYRFFSQSPRREILFVGSVNLTSAAHKGDRNVESGILVERDPATKPEFWLVSDQHRPREFRARTEDDASAASGGSRLVLRYDWERTVAEAFWDDLGESPVLRLDARGVSLGLIGPLPSQVWTSLGAAFAERLADTLKETSLLQVVGDGDRSALLLVQEEGMSHKPSLLLQLSVADILEYWSLLTAEQRTAFLEAHAPELSALAIGSGSDLVTQARMVPVRETLFDKFAGIFHAFGSLERTIRKALDGGNERDATWLLFGKKYDSLGSLLDKVASDQSGNDVEQYLILLCARQLCGAIRRTYPKYWGARRDDVRQLEGRLRSAQAVRERIVAKDAAMPEFLDWFDKWFVPKATRAEGES